MCTIMDIVDLIVQKRPDILATCLKYGATNVRVFGSCARDDYDNKSDVDILVTLNTNKTGWDYTSVLDGIADELEKLLGRKVDVWSDTMLRPQALERASREAVGL